MQPRAFQLIVSCLPSLVCRVDRNFLAVTTHTLKFHNPFNKGEECIVFTATYIVAWVNGCTTLTVNDVPSFYSLTTEFFTAESLTV